MEHKEMSIGPEQLRQFRAVSLMVGLTSRIRLSVDSQMNPSANSFYSTVTDQETNKATLRVDVRVQNDVFEMKADAGELVFKIIDADDFDVNEYESHVNKLYYSVWPEMEKQMALTENSFYFTRGIHDTTRHNR